MHVRRDVRGALYTCKLHMNVQYDKCKQCTQLGITYNTSKENARVLVSPKLPLRHGCICSHTACTQRITCMPIFIARSLGPSSKNITTLQNIQNCLTHFVSGASRYPHVIPTLKFISTSVCHMMLQNFGMICLWKFELLLHNHASKGDLKLICFRSLFLPFPVFSYY